MLDTEDNRKGLVTFRGDKGQEVKSSYCGKKGASLTFSLLCSGPTDGRKKGGRRENGGMKETKGSGREEKKAKEEKRGGAGRRHGGAASGSSSDTKHDGRNRNNRLMVTVQHAEA